MIPYGAKAVKHILTLAKLGARDNIFYSISVLDFFELLGYSFGTVQGTLPDWFLPRPVFAIAHHCTLLFASIRRVGETSGDDLSTETNPILGTVVQVLTVDRQC